MPRVTVLGPKLSLAHRLATARGKSVERRSFFDLKLPPSFFPNRTTYNVKTITIPEYLTPDPAALFLVARKRRPRASYNNGKPVVIADASQMLNTVQVVCTPTADTPGSAVVVHFGTGERYFFGNVAEGAQRIMTQRKVPMSRIDSIFVTGRISSHSMGGMLGMILTVADVRAEYVKAAEEINAKRRILGKAALPVKTGPLEIHGGRNLVHTLATARTFVFRKGLPMNPREIEETQDSPSRDDTTPDWQDENLRVWQVPLVADGWKSTELSNQQTLDRQVTDAVVKSMFGSDWSLDKLHETMLHEVQLPAQIYHRVEGHLQKYEGPLPNGDAPCENIPVLVRKPWPGVTYRSLPDTTPADDSLCYIVKGHAQRGKFKPATAIELGIDRDSFKLLIGGKNVYGKNAVIVTPDMVMEPNIPGNGFAFVDIRYSNLINSFLRRPEWSNAEIMEGIEAIYWVLGDEVKNDQRLIDWMKAHPGPKHIVFGEGISPNLVAFASAAIMTIKMHQIDPDRFPIPTFSNEITGVPDALKPLVEIAQPGETMKLKPKLVFDKESIAPVLNTRVPADEILKDENIMALVKDARTRLADPAFIAEVEASERDLSTHNVEVVSLGTGSSLPSKYRNVSANLIRVPGYGSYLLDCGENTLGQLRRLYGFEGADRIIEDLHAIYISHSHADHHLGTAGVLARRAELIKKNPNIHPVAFIATSSMINWLKEHNQVEDLGFPSHIAIAKVNFTRGRVTGVSMTPATVGHVALPEIVACAVDHCYDAMGVALTWPSGLKIAYSGDCRPSKEFARIGHGAHLLIHESTFDAELQGEAIAKKHSTMAEALEVGKHMQAKRILLTHFSQRYPKFPNVEETDQTVLFAFDLMTVKLHEFRKAELFIPALRLLFVNENVAKDDGPEEAEALKEELDECVPAQKKAKPPKQPKAKKASTKYENDPHWTKFERLGIELPPKRKESPEDRERMKGFERRKSGDKGKKVKLSEWDEVEQAGSWWGDDKPAAGEASKPEERKAENGATP